MTEIVKNVSVMCFHDELCQVYNALMTAVSLPVLACPLNISLFNISPKQLIDGVKVADPAKYYKETVIPADMNLTF